MEDMNTRIANFERTAALRTEGLRTKAAAMRAEPSYGWDEMDRMNKSKAEALEAEAKRWAAITAEAKNGYVLITDDVSYQHEFRDLIGSAAAAGRAKWVTPAVNPADTGL